MLIYLWLYPLLYVFWPSVRSRNIDESYTKSIALLAQEGEIYLLDDSIKSSVFSS